ncbi:DUF6801 domain-containing protein [Streptomyces sp. NRRL WC-3549]|uniref:DUF6801 domain-containing protein n=1 Tax=Streptomyces sp. NRRL WC-3549 TaxID=1463925 RepID=UPI0004C6446E|nr:DUF6801 domain-containing protein [Streptomyces sp. NRRL WC-3549]
MKGSRRTTGARRRTARGAAVATAVLLGGMIPGAQAASGAQEIDAELAYTCALPEGEQPVKVRVAAKVPESAQAGQAIQPEDVTVDLTLPEGALAGLTGSGAATVSAEARLSVDVAQGDQHARAEWAGAAADPVPVPAAGGLTLSTAGSVPYVKPGASGDLTFKASDLSAELTAKKADGTPAGPQSTLVTCTVDEDQETTLATVGTGEGVEPSTPAPSASDEWPDGEAGESRALAPEVGAEAEEPAPADAPPCVGDPMDSLEMVTYVTGYANVTKLNGANKFPLACARIHTYENEMVPAPPGLHLYMKAAMVLEYEGKPQLPPTEGTFLTFGFMPTTAVLEMTQIPPKADSREDANVNVHSIIDFTDPSNNTTVTTVDADFVLRLHDVKVNGTPLDVGDSCRTERPFKLTLVGKAGEAIDPQERYELTAGGQLTGSVTIPPFEGCGVDEDLDSLFTASLSGSPGFVKQMQGAPCIPSPPPEGCTPENQPADIPEAKR